MKITLTNYEYEKSGRRREYVCMTCTTKEVDKALKKAAKDYRTTPAGMIQIVLAYYFGDGANHLGCADCGLWSPGCEGCEPGGEKPNM